MIRRHFELKETIVTIVAEEYRHIEAAESTLKMARWELERFIRKDPFFRNTLESYPVEKGNAPEVVCRMTRSCEPFGLGPMAAVAGTFAQLAVERMVLDGAAHAVVDNGGDICIYSSEPVTVGLYTGTEHFKDLAVEHPPSSRPLSICSSSGTVGPSISFGESDLVTIAAVDCSLADAAATAVGNLVVDGRPDTLRDALSLVDGHPGISGGLVIKGEHLAHVGELKFRTAKVDPGLITRGV